MSGILNPVAYHFTMYAIPPLVVGAAVAALGALVVVREEGSRVSRNFLLLCLSIGIYLVGFGASYASSGERALLFLQVGLIAAIFIPSTVLLLTASLLEQTQRLRAIVAVCFGLSFLLTYFLLFTTLFIRDIVPFFWGNYPSYGPAGYLFIVFFFSIMVVVLRLYVREYRRASSERRRKRLKGMLLAYSIGYAGGIDFAAVLGMPLYPFGYVPIFLFLLINAWVILRYRLVDITPELASGQILETMHGAVIVADPEGRIRVVNRRAEEMLGYRKAELIGESVLSVLEVPPALRDPARLGGHAVTEEVVWSGKGSRRLDVSLSASLLNDGRDDAMAGIVYVAYDITERKRSEEQLKEYLSLKQATLESTADGILVVDGQGKVVDYNSKFMTLWNIPPGLMEQKDDDLLLRFVLGQLKDPEAFVSKVRELYVSPDTADYDEILFRDGRVFERYSVPHRREGRSVGRVWSFRDVTKRKRAEEELQQAGKELQNFAYIVSHDLRAPLVSIRGFSMELAMALKDLDELLQRHLPAMEADERRKIESLLQVDVPEAVHFIGTSVTRMDKMIGSILALSRMGRRELKPEALDTGAIVRMIEDSLAHQIAERRINLTVAALPAVTADKFAMEQIFGNLLDNAVKYLDPGRPGEIAVTAEQDDRETVFHVRDNGRGMAAEDIPKAFEIFRRLGKQDVPGEGMGLAYVRALVRSMGGRIWCESEPGKGAVFSFTVPKERPAA